MSKNFSQFNNFLKRLILYWNYFNKESVNNEKDKELDREIMRKKISRKEEIKKESKRRDAICLIFFLRKKSNCLNFLNFQ